MTARSRQTFEQIVTLPDLCIPLAEATLLLACEEYPHLSLTPYLNELDRMAEIVQSQLGKAGSSIDKIEAINHVLFADYGFRGNRLNYYDPRNSFLNDVIERRTGIPITLSTIYIEVGRRVGLSVDGVGLPGHFLVKCTGGGEEIFLDPFNEGSMLTRDECRQLLPRVDPDPERAYDRWLNRVTNRQILGRLLNNLKIIYVQTETFEKALGMVDLMLLNEPSARHLYKERGMLRLQVRQFRRAAEDLDRYLKSNPTARDRSDIEGHLKKIARMQAMMN